MEASLELNGLRTHGEEYTACNADPRDTSATREPRSDCRAGSIALTAAVGLSDLENTRTAHQPVLR
jgi:hypothetical protein